MTEGFVPFDDVRERITKAIHAWESPEIGPPIHLVRDLVGKVRISISDTLEKDPAFRDALENLARLLRDALGAHAYPVKEAVLFTDDALLKTLDGANEEISPRVFLADRLVTGKGWWTVANKDAKPSSTRITLYSIKGGMGRSTTAAALAWHLAHKGERVLVVDMDLESPGLSSAMLEPERQPEFGMVDWFVEDLVEQADRMFPDMLAAPSWAQALEGDVRVAPAHGRNPGEYLAKLGRAYMNWASETWSERLQRALTGLESSFDPTFVLLESRSGLHDIAAASVTDLDAEVLLFATDSESNWTDCEILFRHWRHLNLAASIRERIAIVSALTPVPDREEYMRRFRARAWDLFRDHLYDATNAAQDAWSFDLDETSAPHNPMEINWTLGLASGASLRNLDEQTMKAAYGRFFSPFDERIRLSDIGGSSD